MDPAALVQNIYRCCREKRLAEMINLLGDDFKFKAELPEDLDGETRSRSRAEIALMVHNFMEQYDILALDPGSITVTDNRASAETDVKFRHKKSGKVLETRFLHDWRVADGKATELEQRHDLDLLRAFVKSVDGDAS
jgi:ketosteroid isomerase-like protein